MTLEEYEKVLEEKRKALLALKTAEERKVDVDEEFKSMQPLSNKKSNDDVFIKVVRTIKFPFYSTWPCFAGALTFFHPFSQGSEKDKRKDAADKEEKAKKVCLFLT